MINSAEDRARTWRREGGQFSPPYTVQLASTTHGASIVYTTEEGEDPHWRALYRPHPGRGAVEPKGQSGSIRVC
ncbi:MAG: chitobiase/beta-hexosaminidase C-terminal domain-containing protein [Balneolaceae bacterium]|nr:chitobiase/beta-hexosaminidase C-terminal domain-containing protein [Balneolaceae bacterium]